MTGPPQPSGAMKLTIHLGNDWRSAVVRSELKRDHPYFLARRLKIERTHVIVLDDDAWKEPTYSIGRGGERQRFRGGAFCCSGAFMSALESICEIDAWDRANPFLDGAIWAEDPEFPEYRKQKVRDHFASRPEPWPPLPPMELFPTKVPDMPVEIPEDAFGGEP